MKANWTWPSVACLAVVATLWLGRADSHAQNRPAAAARPVGVVDIEKLFNQFKQTQDLDAILQERGQALAAEGKQKQATLNQAQAGLDAFHPNSPEGIRQQHKIVRLDLELRAFFAILKQDTDRERLNWTANTYTKLIAAVQVVAARHNIDVVLGTSEPPKQLQGRDLASLRREIILRPVVWHAPQIDLTDEVLAAANRQYQAAGGRSTIKVMIGLTP